MTLSRRHLVMTSIALLTQPRASFAKTARVVAWEDLIPPGVPYSEIIGEGEMDEARDTWLPEFDENATKLNKKLDGAYIKMPGYMLPIDLTSAGVTSFLMVPYVGACLHVPPPPANQLVYVESKRPWASDKMWDPVWVTGRMKPELQSTSIADIGYSLVADQIETYEW
ncbi:MAG: DUF3299 domain-containing protein [Sulfitobacter sp.]